MSANTPRGYTYPTSDDANDVPFVMQRALEQIDADVNNVYTATRTWISRPTSATAVGMTSGAWTTTVSLAVTALPAGQYVVYFEGADNTSPTALSGSWRVLAGSTPLAATGRHDVTVGSVVQMHAAPYTHTGGDVTLSGQLLANGTGAQYIPAANGLTLVRLS